MTDAHNQASSDVNLFKILGFVGRVRAAATPTGREVANFCVATHRLVREPETQRLVEHTEWHDVVAFDDLAATVRNTIRTGTRVQVAGYMRTRRWTDRKKEITHFKHELVATDLEVTARAAAVEKEAEVKAELLDIKITSF